VLNKKGIDRNYQKELDEWNLRRYLIEISDVDRDYLSLYQEFLDNYSDNFKTNLEEYNIMGLDIINTKLLNYPKPNKKVERKSIEKAINDYLEEEKAKSDWLLKKYPANKRISCQQGLFLFSTNSNHSFMENLFFGASINPKKFKPKQILGALTEDSNKFRRIIKLTIDSNLRNNFKKYLKGNGITHQLVVVVDQIFI